MKQFYLLFLCVQLCTLLTVAQSPGKQGNFGIDGDLQSDYHASITLTNAAGTDDWFKNTSGTGLGVIDTSKTSQWAPQIAYGQNIAFSTGMAFPRYSVQNTRLMLDARYARDYFNSDYTLFKSAKNGDDPSQWTLSTTAGTILDKEDLLDAYIHMRRDGTTINNTAPSALILAMGASTYGTSGDRYLDFELYRSRIAFDQAAGRFTNTGAATTGGHTPWQFNTSGMLSQIGDMLVSFSFNSASVSGISVWIWVDGNTYNNINPAGFDFSKVNGDYTTIKVGGVDYGYAKIIPNPGQSFNLMGSVATSTMKAAPWGTNSKDIGYTNYNNFSYNYATGQFAEVSLDLTRMGIDPALNGLMGDPCSPPYTRVLVKSRSSSSLSAALKDFAGPYEFLDAPQPDAQIVVPQTLTCSRNVVTLSPATYQAGAYYQWSTSNGNIVSQADPANVSVNKPGTYTLTAAIAQGCGTITQNVVVPQDISKPVVTAQALGMLTTDPTAYVLLKGNASAPSTDNTPSSGYAWAWSGPGLFSATTQSAQTNIEGNYTLFVTEQRNGCTGTATTSVLRATVLPLALLDFTGDLANNKVQLQWRVAANETGNYFEVQKCSGAGSFKSIATIFTSDNAGDEQYQFADVCSAQPAMYRLKLVNKDGTVLYSKSISFQTNTNENKITLLQNPVQQTLRFTIAAKKGINRITVYNTAGVQVYNNQTGTEKTNALISLNLPAGLPQGMYVLEVAMGTSTKTALFTKG